MDISLPVSIRHHLDGQRRSTAIEFLGRKDASDPARAWHRHRAHLDGCGQLEQVHSATVLEACPGECGRGDALWTDRSRLALAIRTADCVPLVLSTGHRLAAVHAGWRGIEAGIVAAGVDAVAEDGVGMCAWIGPSIRACCYEVGNDVAERLVAVSNESILSTGAQARPHVDLNRAVRVQLAASGVHQVEQVPWCTACHGEHLASYRRDGAQAGRNLTLTWLADA